MIILGIDPGTASTGFGVIKTSQSKTKTCIEYIECGLIKTTPDMPTGERLKKINNELSKMIKKHRPEVLALESLFFFRNLKTALPVSQASGVILLTAAKNKIPVCSFTPMQVKMAVGGHGWAEKEKVHEKLKKILKLKEIPKPDDAADALAIALTYVLKTSS